MAVTPPSQKQNKKHQCDLEQNDPGTVDGSNLTQQGKKQKHAQPEAGSVSTSQTDPPLSSTPTTQRTESPEPSTGTIYVDFFKIIQAEKLQPPKPADTSELAFVYQTGPPPVRHTGMGENKTGFKVLLVLQKSKIFDPSLQESDSDNQNAVVRLSVDEYTQRSQQSDNLNVDAINSPDLRIDLGGQKVLCCYWESVEYTLKVFKGLVRKYRALCLLSTNHHESP